MRYLNRTYRLLLTVPPATLARLELCRYIPKTYHHIVYMDGDIRIVGDITGLIKHDVQDGHVAAANEHFWLWAWGPRKKARAYLDGIGVSKPSDYFNCGILAFSRSTWEVRGPEALRFFLENSERAIYHDQSALNHVFAGRREVLSPVYNFVSNYKLAGPLGVEPKIIHYTGGLKPWQYSGPPWGAADQAPYAEFLRDNAYAAALERVKSAPEQALMARHWKRRKSFYDVANLLLPMLHRARFRQYMRQQKFAVV